MNSQSSFKKPSGQRSAWTYALRGVAVLLGFGIACEPFVAMAQYIPPKRGIPGRREGAGTRSPLCFTEQRPSMATLMPIAPLDQFGATVSKTPSFFWFVPATVARSAEFRLVDNYDQELFVQAIPLDGKAGIVSYQLPETLTTRLEMGRQYRWQFGLLCNADDLSPSLFVEGYVERLDPTATPADASTNSRVTLAQVLEQTTTLSDRAIVYAKAGIWQDAITALVEQRCLRPNDAKLKASWVTLLSGQYVKLEQFSQEPLTATCEALGQR
jgi:hypothetical protein